jgi:hypothetical protein
MPKGEDLVAIRFDDVDRLPEPPDLREDNPASVQTYLLATSVSTAEIVRASTLAGDFDPPIYSVLVLDAIAAFQSNDYRISILLSAMAMEIGFGAALDAAHDSILQKPDDPRYRVLKIAISGGNISLKDPIYERLRERMDFSIRMHEMSLYVLGKSLRAEDDALYKKALKLLRAAAPGGHRDRCTGCGHTSTISYNSCRNRHCPRCQGNARRRRLRERERELLHTRYLPPSESSEAKRKGRSEAEVCTSAARKTAGNPLRRAIGAEPLSEACLPYCVRNAR